MSAVDSHDFDPCVICIDQQAQALTPPGYDGIQQNCPRCGEFKVTGTALTAVGGGLGRKKRSKLSGWTFDQNRAGAIPTITGDNLRKILTRPLPSVPDRASRLLVEAGRGQTELGQRFDPSEPRFLAATYSSSPQEVDYLLDMLVAQGWAARKTKSSAEIAPSGYFQLDDLRRSISVSSQAFVAMWFDDKLNDAYQNGFQIGILDAGYDPIRVDKIEHINRIDDEIIAQIKASRFVVADFTGHRGGVYFEAGYALGLDMPVIWTCRRDDIGELHFDIRQFNCIDWESPIDLAKRLGRRVEATVGLGPGKALA